VAIGAATSDRVAGLLGKRGSVAALLVVPAVLVACALDGSARPVVLALASAAAWGFSGPFLLALLNRHIESDRRATVLSVSAMVGRVLLVPVGPLFGLLADRYSDRVAFGALAALFLALAATAGLLQLRSSARQPAEA
jgi:MFS family permease